VATTDALAQGPQVVAGQAAWVEIRCARGCGIDDTAPVERYEVKLARAGQRPRTILRRDAENAIYGGPSDYFEGFRFSVSSSHVAASKVINSGDGSGESTTSSLSAGGRGRRLRTVRECDYEPYGGSAYGLGGAVIAYDASCTGATPTLTMRDLVDGTSVSVAEREGMTIESVRVDGGYVGVLLSSELVESEEIAVYDVAGRLARRVPFSERPEGFDVQADGTLVACSGGELRAYSSAGAQVLGDCIGDVRATDGRIVHAAPARGGTVLRVSTLDAGSRDLVDLGTVEHTPFDADATHAAYGLRTCDGRTQLVLIRLTSALGPAPDPRCPATVARRPLRPSARGRVSVRLRCPRGCTGAVALKRNGGLLTTESFVARPGPRRVVLALGQRLRRTLRRKGAMRVMQIVRITNRDGQGTRIARPVRLVSR
jgi:hypothetical protein